MDDLTGKTYVITGATSGIGLAIVEQLLQKGANVIGIGRSEERCRQAGDQLNRIVSHGKVAWCRADFRLQAEIQLLAQQIQLQMDDWKLSGLDGLVNNAATVPFRRTVTPDGYEMQWAVNHLAAFILSLQLLPALRAARNARILTVSSGSHYRGRIWWDDVQFHRHYSLLRAYEQTKLCNVLFSAELDRHLSGGTVRAFAVDPGLVRTDLGMKTNNRLASGIWAIRRRGGISPQESAAGIVYLLTEPCLQDATEIYWKHRKPKSPNPIALDVTAGRRLWELTLPMTGINPEYFI
jgi:NAD(P)-dependent dehydrogenase (short-subunit alcohol dehydrogenase family)